MELNKTYCELIFKTFESFDQNAFNDFVTKNPWPSLHDLKQHNNLASNVSDLQKYLVQTNQDVQRVIQVFLDDNQQLSFMLFSNLLGVVLKPIASFYEQLYSADLVSTLRISTYEANKNK